MASIMSRLLTLCFLSAAAFSGFAVERPNILWITSEDNGPHLGCYGDDYAVTPHLDKLAERGLRYTRASSTAPVCAPARTTIISGIYPTATGSQHMRSMVPLPEGFRMFPQFLREAGYYCTNNSKEDYNLEKPGRVWDESSRRAHWKNREEGQPFFAVFNFTISHESRIRNQIEEEHQIHDPAKAPVPAYHPDTPEVRGDWAQYYDRLTMMDRECGDALRELEEAGLTDDTIVVYWGDHGSGMPRNKRWPYNSGLHVPLLLHVPEKFRSLAPPEYEEGGASDRMVGFVDLAPTMLSLVGIEPPGWMQGHAFAGVHEVDSPEFSFGFRGRMDERYDIVRTVMGKRYVYLRHYMPHKIYGQYIQYMFATPTTQVWHDLDHAGKLNEDQSLFWQTKPTEELYDLERDPDEVNNLVASPDHADVLEAMRAAHMEHLRSVRDLGFLSEYELHARANAAGLTPYEMGQRNDLYAFERIFAAAQLATAQNEEDLPEIIGFLESEDSAVRYWGAMGLLIHEEAGVKAGGEALRAALSDDSPIVQITAAEALGRYGSDEDVSPALDVLVRWIDPAKDTFLGIAAWNALDKLDERARPAADRLAATSPRPENPPNGRVSKYSTNLKKKTLSDLGVNASDERRRRAKGKAKGKTN